MIIEHQRRGLEILVFYRDRKYEFDGAGFLYLGPFVYGSHKGSAPTDFTLYRELSELDQAAAAADLAAFDPASIEDARKKTLAAIVRRQGQPAFRLALLSAYEGRCAVTGCDVTPALEAAHIVPYKGPETNHVTNGLLLRADIHTLFDLGLIAVDERAHKLLVAPHLRHESYIELAGKRIHLPKVAARRPNPTALRQHRELAGLE
jgi:predicted restriction endonuclease